MYHESVGVLVFSRKLKESLNQRIDSFVEFTLKENAKGGDTKVRSKRQWMEKYKEWSTNQSERSLNDLIKDFLSNC